MEQFNLDNNSDLETTEEELVSDAMNNAYNILTGKESYDSLLYEGVDRIPLPFNPFDKKTNWDKIIDTLIEHYIQLEWYERCAKLVELKKRN